MKKIKMIVLFAIFGLIGFYTNITNVNAASCKAGYGEFDGGCKKYCSENTNAELQNVLSQGVAISSDVYGTQKYTYNYRFYIGGNTNTQATYYLHYDKKNHCKNDKSKYCNVHYTEENKNTNIYYLKKDGNSSCLIGRVKFTDVVNNSLKCPRNDDKKNLTKEKISAKVARDYDNGTFTIKYKAVSGYKVRVRKYNKAKEEWELVDGCTEDSCYLGKQVGNGTVSFRVTYYVDDSTNPCNNQPVKEIKLTDEPKFKKNPYIEKGACDGYNQLNAALKGVISKCKHQYVSNEASTPSQQKLDRVEHLIEKAKELNQTLTDFAEYGNSSLKKYIENEQLLDRSRPSIDPQYCKFNKGKNVISKKTYTTEVPLSTSAAKYFKMVCQESISGDYDTPKLVTNNGGGFSYDVNIKHDVSCYFALKDDNALEKLLNIEECDYSAYAVADPDGTNTSTSGVLGAGPTEEFDACVRNCDGGKYTQSCINSCGAKAKDKKTQLSFTSTSFSNSNIRKVENPPTSKPAGAERWTEDWCYYGPYHATKSDGSTYTHEGYMRCIYSAASGGKIIGKMFTTNDCTAIKQITVTNPETGKNASANITGWRGDQLYTTGIEVNNKGYVSGAGCYVADTDKIIEEELGKISASFNQAKADYERYVGTAQLNTSNIDAEYTIHNSSEPYCDGDKSKDVVYTTTSTENKLVMNPLVNLQRSGKQVPDSLVDKKQTTLSFGFPNVCLKDGKTKKGSGNNGCCNPTIDGMTGGKKFYMDVTTENNINNVYMWPTGDNANFTLEEEQTIKAIREDVKNKTGSNVIAWDANEISNKTDGIETPKEACNENGYKFKFKFKYNIKANFKNIGVLGDENNRWNIDINCFYGYYNPNMGSCGIQLDNIDIDGDEQLDTIVIKETLCEDVDHQIIEVPGSDKHTTTLVSDYIFRTVDVTDLFNKSTERPWNWQTSETTKAATSLLSAQGKTYKIDPNTTVTNIQNTGYAYTDYRNFGFTISSINMRNIRKYNTDHPNIATSTCTNKTVGCNNEFIKDTNYVEKATGDLGLTYNNKRDIK